MSVGMFLNCRQMFQVVRINFTFHADVGDINHMKETAYKILFLEDEPTIREVLTEYMLMSGRYVPSGLFYQYLLFFIPPYVPDTRPSSVFILHIDQVRSDYLTCIPKGRHPSSYPEQIRKFRQPRVQR